jgi:hypothetical protein
MGAVHVSSRDLLSSISDEDILDNQATVWTAILKMTFLEAAQRLQKDDLIERQDDSVKRAPWLPGR